MIIYAVGAGICISNTEYAQLPLTGNDVGNSSKIAWLTILTPLGIITSITLLTSGTSVVIVSLVAAEANIVDVSSVTNLTLPLQSVY